MKEKLKIGGRVATYDGAHRKTGTITGFSGDLLEVEHDDGTFDTFNVKQCRRLKPPERPREFWVHIRKFGYPLAFTMESGGRGLEDVTEVIHVREVKK